MLKGSGELLGFKMRPDNKEEYDQPLNRFSVKACQVMATDDPRYSEINIIIRCFEFLNICND